MSDAAPEKPEKPPPKPLVTGVASALSPMVRRVLAPNSGVMTGPGTNTYLVGIDEVAVIDPAIDHAAHLEAIVGCGGDRIRWILCTHTHPDHSPGAAALKKLTGAEVLAFDSRDGLDVDTSIGDGFRIEATEFRLRAVHTPGHASNHLCYLLEQERLLFSGDHIMQGSTVVIAPPDGDMAAYLESLARIRKLRLRSIAPGHGYLIDDPNAVIDDYVTHRLEREQQVLRALESGDRTAADIVARIYTGLIDELVPRAEQSVHAHLRKLAAEGRVRAQDVDDPKADWVLNS
jgi:glyoxylase-like metal-dependent hydrolase (beta-lactamase superfamily II)